MLVLRQSHTPNQCRSGFIFPFPLSNRQKHVPPCIERTVEVARSVNGILGKIKWSRGKSALSSSDGKLPPKLAGKMNEKSTSVSPCSYDIRLGLCTVQCSFHRIYGSSYDYRLGSGIDSCTQKVCATKIEMMCTVTVDRIKKMIEMCGSRKAQDWSFGCVFGRYGSMY